MAKISPVAAYLTANKAIAKTDGKYKNICHFLTPDGCYIGKQVKMKQPNGPTMLLRVIYGEGIRPAYIENVVVNKGYICTGNQSGTKKVLTYHSLIFRQLVDFFSEKQFLSTKETKLTNPLHQIGIIQQRGIPVFETIENPEYTSRVFDVQEFALEPKTIPHFTIN